MANFDLYKKMLFAAGNTQNTRNTQKVKDDFIKMAVDNPSYTHDKAYKNGQMQQFLITQSTTKDKADLITFPDEDIVIGDMVFYNDKHWIVYEVSQSCEWQKKAVLWLCNLKIQFQIGTPEIYERWCVLDSGVYSTTITGDKTVQVGDKQYNLWITKDDITKYIYVDKRLAIGKKYNKDGEEILDIFSVTAVDSISKNYGENSHIIKISLRDASNFNADTDNVEKMICDEVFAQEIEQNVPTSTERHCEISGKKKVRLGGTITLTAKFYENEQEVNEIASWVVEPYENISIDGNKIIISIPKEDKYIGTKYEVTLTEKGANTYGTAKHTVEVD